MNKNINTIAKIIVYPFILGLFIVVYNIYALHQSILFLRYGGEWINYNKSDKITIQDIYLELKKQKQP